MLQLKTIIIIKTKQPNKTNTHTQRHRDISYMYDTNEYTAESRKKKKKK